MRTALVLGCLLLAGCSGPSTLTPTTTTGAASQAPAANANVTAPQWAVGDSWTHHWYLGPDDATGFEMQAVVAENRTDGWLVASGDRQDAAFHGAFVFPTLGLFAKGDLTAHVGSYAWPWYHPSFGNANWTTTVHTRSGDATDVTFDVQFQQVADTTRGTLNVRATTGGRLVAVYDYDAATQWFKDARFYGEAAGMDEAKWDYRITTTAHASHFTGPVYDDTGTVLLTYTNVVVPTSPTAPQPNASFTVGDETLVLALRITFAAGGAHETVILDPGNNPQNKTVYHQEAYGADGQAADLILAPGIPGTWQVASAGGSAFASGSIVYAYGIHERVITL